MMKRGLQWFLGLLLVVSMLTGCSTSPALLEKDTVAEVPTQEETQEPEEELAPAPLSIEELEHTEHFAYGSLAHIFHGEVNKKGKAVGYHSESMEGTPGSVIEGTRSTPNEEGVYRAQVEVDGVKKTSNKGYSSFFPEEWDAQQVVDAINEAYETRQFDNGNTYIGETKEGILIQMYLNQNDKIISAFPIY